MPPSYIDNNGVWHHTFRQSWLSTADRCPELARRTHFDLIDKRETDAAALGTSVHEAIQAVIEHGYDFDTAREILERDFIERVLGDEFVWVKYKKIDQCLTLGASWLSDWYEEILPTLNTFVAATEYPFNVPFYYDERREIRLTGTIDYLEDLTRIKDWKTSGGKAWEPWEKKRWDVQSSVYTYAVDALYGTRPEFEFVVLGGRKGTQRIKIERGPADWRWLGHKCVSYAGLIEARLDPWPLSDSSALCSPKWCEAWRTCKGAHLGDDPW